MAINYDEVLATRVKVVNKANKYANEILPKLLETFRPFLGQKIQKVNGDLLLKVKEAVETLGLPNTSGLHCFCQSGPFNLIYRVSASETTSFGHAYYHTVDIYVATFEEAILKELYRNHQPHKDNYTVDDVRKLREKYRTTKDAFDKAQSALEEFGENDR